MRLFECIGIPFVNEEITSQRFSELAASGDSQERVDGGRTITWMDDSSGAVMVFNTNERGEIVCAQPAFHAGFDFRGTATRFGLDPDGCRFCEPLIAVQPEVDAVWRAPGSEEWRPKFVFHLGNAGLVRERIVSEGPVDLIVAGFAEEVRVWSDEAAFLSEPGNEKAKPHMMGAHFDPANPSPSQYFLTGQVLDAEERINSATQTPFWVLTLDAPFVDNNAWLVLARPDDLPFGAAPGEIVEAHVWACAMAIID